MCELVYSSASKYSLYRKALFAVTRGYVEPAVWASMGYNHRSDNLWRFTLSQIVAQEGFIHSLYVQFVYGQ